MPSARYLALSARLQNLRDHFLPADFSPTGDYTERERDYARAYRLLAHAEFEAYLEDWGSQLAQAAGAAFKQDAQPRTVVLNLVGFHSNEANPNEKRIKQLYGEKKEQIEAALDSALRSYFYAVNNNNGIRQTDVLRILIPIGFKVADISASLLATLDSFGVNRGSVAHTASSTQQQIDPKTEYDTVELIRKDLEIIDSRFEELMASC